tara:strand:+ start:2689 stop:3135 length:447 start_codon:yes stop_codon:yes gene_type:complete
MNNAKPMTAEDFKDVKYGDLLAKFTELGIPDVWKAGKKKKQMIDKAIEQLAVIKSLENSGLKEEDIKEELKIVEVKKAEAKEAKELEEVVEAKKADKAIVAKVENAGLTQDQIKANLKSIEQNLMSNVPAQRIVLLKKKEALLALLDK